MQKNRIVSNHCCTCGSPSTPRFLPPLAKCLYCLFPLCPATLKSCYIIALLCTKIYPQEEGDRETGTLPPTLPPWPVAVLKQASKPKKKKKSPRKISPDSLPPTSMAPSVTFYTFTFSYYCNSALHPFATHIRTCRILLIIMNSGS